MMFYHMLRLLLLLLLIKNPSQDSIQNRMMKIINGLSLKKLVKIIQILKKNFIKNKVLKRENILVM